MKSIEPIALSESRRLIALEETIEAGRQTFVEVGLALAEIRDSRLYRNEHKTFESYCKARWNFSRQYAHCLIASSDAVATMPEKCQPVVDNERAARALSKVEPSKRVEVLEKAASSGKVTAKSIREAAEPEEPARVESYDPRESDPTPEPEPQKQMSTLAYQAIAECDYVIQDVEEIKRQFREGVVDPGTWAAAARELGKVSAMFYKVSKEKPS